MEYVKNIQTADYNGVLTVAKGPFDNYGQDEGEGKIKQCHFDCGDCAG